MIISDAKSPLVSVIVPSYNHAAYIEECLLSIVSQTYKNIELIVIDDGSLDSSRSIIMELAEKHNIIYKFQENSGVSKTLNNGIRLATGDFICVCASDDKYHEEKISKQVDYMLSHSEYDICYTNRIKFYENGIKRSLPANKQGSGDLFKPLFLQDIRICPGTIMYRKQVFDSVGYFDESLAVEDFDFILRVAKKHLIGHLNEYLFYYRSHANNTVNQVDKMKVNSDAILYKWKSDKLYNRARLLNNIHYFRAYSSLEKIKAIKVLPFSFLIFTKTHTYQGLIRLLIPKSIYKKIMKLK